MAVITDATMLLIKNQMAARNEKLKNFVELYAATTWDRVQLDVKTMSKADLLAKYPIGTELVCGYKLDGTTYDFPWVVLDVRDCEGEDGITRQGLWLGAKYATIEDIQFDAAEDTVVDLTEEPNALEGWHYWGITGSTYTALNLATGAAIPTTYDSIHKCGINNVDALRYGYNRYRDSAQRQWLNSAAPAGEWWESTHLGDKAPSQLASRAGFVAGLDADFVSVVSPVRVQVATNTVTDSGVTDVMYDKFFLQSLEELYGVPQAPGVEGEYFPYWKEITGLDAPSNGSGSNTNPARQIRRINNPTGSAANVRLRSAYRGASNAVWIVNSSGYLSSSYASSSYAALPACVIY